MIHATGSLNAVWHISDWCSFSLNTAEETMQVARNLAKGGRTQGMAGASSTQLFDCMGSLHSHPFLWTNISFWIVWKLTFSIYIKHHNYFFFSPTHQVKGSPGRKEGNSLPAKYRALCSLPTVNKITAAMQKPYGKSNLEAKNLKKWTVVCFVCTDITFQFKGNSRISAIISN